MIQTPQNRYLENAVSTANPAQLLIMLCDGAIRFCKSGIEAIHQNKFEKAHTYLTKTQNIITEFIITIDRKAPIAEGLLKLYDYFLYKLIEANTKKIADPAEEVLMFLNELKEIWIQALKSSAPVSSGHTYG